MLTLRQSYHIDWAYHKFAHIPNRLDQIYVNLKIVAIHLFWYRYPFYFTQNIGENICFFCHFKTGKKFSIGWCFTLRHSKASLYVQWCSATNCCQTRTGYKRQVRDARQQFIKNQLNILLNVLPSCCWIVCAWTDNSRSPRACMSTKYKYILLLLNY